MGAAWRQRIGKPSAVSRPTISEPPGLRIPRLTPVPPLPSHDDAVRFFGWLTRGKNEWPERWPEDGK